MGIFSFNAVKALAMGDGGGLAIRNEHLLNRAKSFRYLGLADTTRSGLDALSEGQNQRWWEFQVQDLAGRHISNDILAAIGRVQLKKVPGFIRRRKEVWALYQDGLKNIPGLRLPPEPLEGCESAYFMYWLQTDARDALAAHLTENGVYCTFRYFPLHLVEHFGPRKVLPGADRANEITLNIPLHQNLSDEDVARVIDLVAGFFK
jgi:aminotransferase